VIFSVSTHSVRGILLDIEGTTTPIEFVYRVLFPFVRERLQDYLTQNATSEDFRQDITVLRQDYLVDVSQNLAPPPWTDDKPTDFNIESIAAYVHWLMDRDRKSTGLKLLQGKIWQKGYLAGELKGRVFPDVPTALARWSEMNLDVRIFSSGSVLAQKLLFANTEFGDLTKFLRGYFDPAFGSKISEDSYRRIASEFRLPPSEILFISDTPRELDAAKAAGMQSLLCARHGSETRSTTHGQGVISSFDEII
jgi:enolase-phosphatase E1